MLEKAHIGARVQKCGPVKLICAPRQIRGPNLDGDMFLIHGPNGLKPIYNDSVLILYSRYGDHPGPNAPFCLI